MAEVLSIGGYTFPKRVDTSESIKDEVSFAGNAFLTSDKQSDLVALAMRIQTLLIMEKGTNPGALLMGVGIRNIISEFADDITLNETKTLIDEQIRTYLPNNEIKSIELFFNPKRDEKNTAYLLVALRNANNSLQKDMFAISFAADNHSSTQKLVSNIMV